MRQQLGHPFAATPFAATHLRQANAERRRVVAAQSLSVDRLDHLPQPAHDGRGDLPCRRPPWPPQTHRRAVRLTQPERIGKSRPVGRGIWRAHPRYDPGGANRRLPQPRSRRAPAMPVPHQSRRARPGQCQGLKIEGVQARRIVRADDRLGRNLNATNRGRSDRLARPRPAAAQRPSATRRCGGRSGPRPQKTSEITTGALIP